MQCPWGSEEGIGSLWNWSYMSILAMCGCYELSPGPLGDTQVLFDAEPWKFTLCFLTIQRQAFCSCSSLLEFTRKCTNYEVAARVFYMFSFF